MVFQVGCIFIEYTAQKVPFQLLTETRLILFYVVIMVVVRNVWRAEATLGARLTGGGGGKRIRSGLAPRAGILGVAESRIQFIS